MVNKMNHKERFYNALMLKEVDRLPHGEQMIHDSLVAKIVKNDLPDDDGNALAKWMCEAMTDENFARHKNARNFLGFDWVQVFPMESLTEIGKSEHGNKLAKDIWGAVQEITSESSVVVKKPIESLEEMANYKFPDISEFGFENVIRWVDDGEFFVASQVDTGFFKVNQLVGFEEYMEYIYFNKEEMHDLMKKFTEFQKRMIDHLIDLGVDCIWLSDDHAFNSGPFIPPHLMQEFDFDYMKQIVDYVHSKNVPVILHTCGNINKTIEQIVATGINGLHAIQPSAHNDIYFYKQKYGKQICLIGNLDINELLPLGSPFAIGEKIQEMVDKLFYDKTGFVLATCNLLNSDIPIENAISMHLLAEKYN